MRKRPIGLQMRSWKRWRLGEGVMFFAEPEAEIHGHVRRKDRSTFLETSLDPSLVRNIVLVEWIQSNEAITKQSFPFLLSNPDVAPRQNARRLVFQRHSAVFKHGSPVFQRGENGRNQSSRGDLEPILPSCVG